MSNSQNNPARSNDAHQDGAPPPPTQQPPHYSEQPRIELHDAEAAGASSQAQQDGLPAATRTKSEASTYAGSYRPSDAQQAPAECVPLQAHGKSHMLTVLQF